MSKHLFIAVTALALFLMPGTTFGQNPSLGTAANFVLFTSTGAITNVGTTHLTGNVGSNSGASTGFGNVDGQMHSGDGVTATAAADLLNAYHQLDTAVATFFPAPLLGNGDTLINGVYHITGGTTLNGKLYLNAQGNPNAVFIIQVQAPLSISAASKVILINAAKACNVYWKVEGLVSIAPNATMRGTIIANNAAINMNASDTLEGRALSTAGAITTNGVLAYTPIGGTTPILTGPAAPPLATTAAYGIFSANGSVSNGGITHVIGDVGSNTDLTTGFNPLFVTGTIHSIPDTSTAHCAADLLNVYTYLNTLPHDIELLYPAQFGNGLVLTPHTYLMNAATTFTGTVYLNAEGNSDAVFIIQINGALVSSTFSNVMLINGAQAKNVFWKVDGAVHIYDNSIFNGTIVANNGAINLASGDSIKGRALTTNGAVSTNGINEALPSGGPICAAPPINGTAAVCEGAATTLTDATTGGTWVSGNTAIATVDSASGAVTGVLAGTAVITYTLSTGCNSVVTVTVNRVPAPITGASLVCTASMITLSDATAGGTWTSSDPAQATVTPLFGVVTGVTEGMPVITYALPLTGCKVTKTITTGAYASAIIGDSTVCVGSTITLTDSTAGGTWSRTNTNAAVSGGIVTGVTAGIDTIRYTVNNVCGTSVASKTITIDPTPGAITGPALVCVSNTITLSDTSAGGTWTSSDPLIATADPILGTVTGVSTGMPVITYTLLTGCIATRQVTVGHGAGAITGDSTLCAGSNITLTDSVAGGTWSSSNANATVLAGVVAGVTAGKDTIKYTVTNLCGITTTTKSITINPAPGAISGPSLVCISSTVNLSDTSAAGIWSSSDPTVATVGPFTGVVTGVSNGFPTITYTLLAGCRATKNITAGVTAGVITGDSSVCIGATTTLTDSVSGGTWSATNANAMVTGGVVSGMTAGIDTINYLVTNICGSSTASKTITVNALPAPVTGPSLVCIGSTITLSDTSAGGIWSSSDPLSAAVTPFSGVVNGVSQGAPMISYTFLTGCTATKVVYVGADAGSIMGAATVCAGSATTLTDSIPGGIWNSSNGTATIAAGTVTGVTAGIDTIRYTVTNICGTATSTRIMTINPIPGPITGPSLVCVSSVITLSDTSTAGIWSSSDPSQASVPFSPGTVTGVSPGTPVISYTFITGCYATKSITVGPDAGSVLGNATVCVGSTIVLLDSITGGSWSGSNATANVTGAFVTGAAAGIDTITYTVANLCGTVSATKVITVNPTPALIAGTLQVCEGSTTSLTDGTTGGTWSSNAANAAVGSTGMVSGITAGTATIAYRLPAGCASTATVTVNPAPGAITGILIVCSGSTTTLNDTAMGGTWTSDNNSTATVGTSGIVTGIIAGIDTIVYTLPAGCTSAIAVTVNATPDVAAPADQVVCNGTATNAVHFTGTVSGTVFNWTSDNTSIGLQVSGTGDIASFIATNATNIPEMDAVIITPVANGCTGATQTFTILVNPTPVVDNTPGQQLCSGTTVAAISFYSDVAGSTYSWANGNTSIGLTGSGTDSIPSFTAINNSNAPVVDTITVTAAANGCSGIPDTFTITVINNPAAPVIATTSAAAVCDEVFFQNFGAATLPPAGINYSWSATNAQVSDTGSTQQYALINFKTTGAAVVTLTASAGNTGCMTSTSYTVNVSSTVADAPAEVIRFNNSFVCLQNNEDAIQWGYDDVSTLAPTVIAGAINQDYDNASPDYTSNNYWVEVSHNGCIQKTYFNKPGNAQMRTAMTEVTVFPNPANNNLQVVINTTVAGDVQLEVSDVLGQKMYATTAVNNKAIVDVSRYPAGVYQVVCYRAGLKISSSRFIKN